MLVFNIVCVCVRNGLGRLEEEAIDLTCCLVGYLLCVGTAEPWADLLVYSWFTHCCCLHLCLSSEAQSILTYGKLQLRAAALKEAGLYRHGGDAALMAAWQLPAE